MNTQISPVGSESSLCDQCVTKGPSFLHANIEDYDQTVDIYTALTHLRIGLRAYGVSGIYERHGNATVPKTYEAVTMYSARSRTSTCSKFGSNL